MTNYVNNNVKVRATEVRFPVTAKTNVGELISSLEEHLGVKEDYDSYVSLEKGVLYRYTDTSGRGEHFDSKETISKDVNVIAMYNAVRAMTKAYSALPRKEISFTTEMKMVVANKPEPIKVDLGVDDIIYLIETAYDFNNKASISNDPNIGALYNAVESFAAAYKKLGRFVA